MRSVAPMKAAKIGYIAISAALCILGVILIVFPGFSVSMLGIICGILLIVFGAVKLIGYFSRDLYRLAFQFDLAFGILLIVLGIVMLLRPSSLFDFICLTLGVSILADALLKIQISLDAKRFGLREWWLILVSAIVAGAFGVIMVFRPSQSSIVITTLLGITFLADGILNFSTAVTAVKIIRHQQPDYIDVDYKDADE